MACDEHGCLCCDEDWFIEHIKECEACAMDMGVALLREPVGTDTIEEVSREE